MNITTRTQGTCAVDDCAKDNRDVIRDHGVWHKIRGEVFTRGAFVVDSWATACPEHQDEVTHAVTRDVEEWPERWHVVVGTQDYGTNGPHPDRIAADGDGNPETLF
ncbi:hypothetical protein EEW87_17580 (plasmid) [Janibacter melonis]|uniref:Uncharacterized protein n=1 Tax=Janibacter melonis TaxID=262209 RepID=A0A650GEX5_9MICO|nr:hypothetical protein [Janibacter melonis]QGX08816.1 hypothetical protein EEW87_17580 [Janibacter melonis]